jgi:transcriptional regulator with AAA-type ATPase domain
MNRMQFLSHAERSFLTAVSQVAYTNPFLPERVEFERAALGSEFVEGEAVWSLPVENPEETRKNIKIMVKRLEPLAVQLQARLAARVAASPEDLAIYEDAILHLLYQQYQERIFNAGPGGWRFYQDFLVDWDRIFVPGVAFPTRYEPGHTFACFRQIRHAFETIFSHIIGSSLPAARLRASVWQSIFSHDMRRYRRTLYERMGDFATLITGPSGTGKELAARAIAESRYVAFDTKKLAFADADDVTFFPINISALSPTLVESELFGHRRGSFTGATGDRKGWLQTCPALGSVFLDELGDLDPTIQVKLLRVIETRTFHPVGDTASLQFRGKLIAATNRDLASDIQEGRFREDLYYRLCSDQIATPSLAEQIASSPHVLWEVAAFLARKVAGAEAEDLSQEVMEWIGKNLPRDYAWPGNYRELEQCLKNVLIRRNYRPSRPAAENPAIKFEQDFRAGRLTAEQVLSRYCAIVYKQTGSYEETARRVQLDRRTVKSKVLQFRDL